MKISKIKCDRCGITVSAKAGMAAMIDAGWKKEVKS